MKKKQKKPASLEIISFDLLGEYKESISKNLKRTFLALRESPLSTRTFSFYTSVSAIASSRIEGEPLEVDSYIKHRMLNVKYLPNLVQKPDDLYQAYRFAQSHPLNKKNFLLAHKKLAAHLLPIGARGALRKTEMVVMKHGTNRIQYEAAPVLQVPRFFTALWKDIVNFARSKMTVAEAFFAAAYIHLVFVNLHPFEDGNGRAGRLLEKWFLATVLGPKAWFLQSEMHYYNHVFRYYRNLARLGMFHADLDYSKALPFLLMLPEALKPKTSGKARKKP